MKKTIIFYSIIISFIIFFSGSCNTKCDCYIDPYATMVSEYDVKKSIIQVNSTNFATGFETIFGNPGFLTNLYNDSTLNAQMCQSVINPVRFFNDESGYFFVESYNAWMVAHATKPELVGTYRYDVKDINGKYYVRDMVEAIKYKGYGFVDYYFEHPETGLNTKKLSFVKSIPAAEFFIGTGYYDYNHNRYYTKEEAALTIVENVTKSMAEGISGGFKIMTDSIQKVDFCRQIIDHIRFFDNQSGYFFIYDFSCVNVAHGTQKNLQGQNLYDYQDSHGNYVIRGLVDVVKSTGSGYYKYYWENPANGIDEMKISYVIQIPNTEYFIGAGFYVN